jgi:cell division protein ZipA
MSFEDPREKLFKAIATRNAALEALPTNPSEEASSILGMINLPTDDAPEANEREYVPRDEVEWVVTATFAGSPRLDPRAISQLFDENWKQVGSFTIFGRDADSGRWTHLIPADGPAAVTSLKFAWNYVDPLSDNAALATKPIFEQWSAEIARKLHTVGEAALTQSLSPTEAVARTKELADLKAKLDYTAVLILRAPSSQRFDGRDIWDVMLCLGLEWGDVNCFHWRGTLGQGDDYLFSVETSTPPGCFPPGQIAAGRLHVEDLVFLYSVPRCSAPTQVFDAMSRAVAYCQKRLDGEIQDGHGRPANLAELRRRISDVERQLKDAGIQPGDGPAMRLF